MKTIGKRIQRTLITLVVVLFVLAAVAPYNATAQPLAQTIAPQSDDFNRCALGTGLWEVQKGANLASPHSIAGAYTGDSLFTMSLAPGTSHTFSSSNMNAPRIMQQVSDQDFEVELRMMAPVNSNDPNGWHMQGLLFRDRSGTDFEDGGKWLRVEFDSHGGVLKTYVAYVESLVPGTRTIAHIDGPTGPVGYTSNNPLTGPLTIKVKYVQTTGEWTVTWTIGAGTTITPLTVTFNEGAVLSAPGFTTFNVTDIGIFVATTGAPSAANNMRVDYFHNTATALQDDAIVLTRQTVGPGSINQTGCSGTTVTLNAVPGTGALFTGWSGDASGTNPTVNVNMNASKSVTATFEVDDTQFNYLYYLPMIAKN